jgi:hypothetical protein
VNRLDKVVVFADCNGLGVGQGALQFAGEFVDSHVFVSPNFVRIPAGVWRGVFVLL